MADEVSVASAQAESQSIIAALRKGHEALLQQAAPATNPTFFAWSQVDGTAALLKKRASETGDMFPFHVGVPLTRSTKPTGEASATPLPLYEEFKSVGWQSETRASLASPTKETKATEKAAGFENLVAVKQPVQFAWSRLDEGIDAPPAPPAEIAATPEDSDAVAPPAPPVEPAAPASIGTCGGAPMALDPDTHTTVSWRSEYASRFPLYEGAEKPTLGKSSGSDGASLTGIFVYPGVGSVVESESNDKFKSHKQAKTEVVKPEASEPTAPTPAAVVAEPELALAPEPAAESVSCADPVPAAAPEPATVCDAATETTPATISAPAQSEEPPLHRTLSNAMEHTNAAQLYAPAPAAGEGRAGGAATKALYCSEAHARFSWPGGVPPPPPLSAPSKTAAPAASELPVPPTDHDLIGGTMQTGLILPESSVAPLKEQLAKGNKEKFVSESRSKFAWPEKSMALLNRQSAAKKPAAAGGELWVMGHKGKLMPPPPPLPEPTPAVAATEDAGCQTGSAGVDVSVPVLDVMEQNFRPVTASSAGALTISAPSDAG